MIIIIYCVYFTCHFSFSTVTCFLLLSSAYYVSTFYPHVWNIVTVVTVQIYKIYPVIISSLDQQIFYKIGKEKSPFLLFLPRKMSVKMVAEKCFWFLLETFCVRNKFFPVCSPKKTSYAWATMCARSFSTAFSSSCLGTIEICTGPANDPGPQMIREPRLIFKLDRKWTQERKWSPDCTGNGRLAINGGMRGLGNLDNTFKTVIICNAGELCSIWTIWMQVL